MSDQGTDPPVITDEMCKQLVQVWYEVRKKKLSVSKARKRLEAARDKGCLMLNKCAECPKLRECPITDSTDEDEEN